MRFQHKIIILLKKIIIQSIKGINKADNKKLIMVFIPLSIFLS